jgi:hypothetical protein
MMRGGLGRVILIPGGRRTIGFGGGLRIILNKKSGKEYNSKPEILQSQFKRPNLCLGLTDNNALLSEFAPKSISILYYN